MFVFINGNKRALLNYMVRGVPCGILVNPHGGVGVRFAARSGLPWGLDNGAFTEKDPERFWVRVRETLRLGRSRKGWGNLKFIVMPDVFDKRRRKGDARATLYHLDMLTGGFWPLPEYDLAEESWWPPLALVGQDGMEDYDVDEVFNHAMLGAFFIGGSTAWKLSRAAEDLADEARHRGLWVHMGRVNSVSRLAYAASIRCDSIDGTGLVKFRAMNLDRVGRFYDALGQWSYPMAKA